MSDDLVQEFIEPFKKTVNHNQGLAKEILKNCQDVPALLKGFQVDTLHLVSPKWKRMEAVMERTARGLIYHHYDTIICEDKTIIRTFALDCIRKVDIKTKELLKSICQHSEIHSIGETFLYSTFQFHGNYVVFMVVNKSVEYVSIFTDREIDMANMNKKRRQARNRRKAFKRSRKNK
ncbi:MAG: hypothetical protein NE334_12625 [Lentisphaeraceae bacterium]|nr:hypothetical protein [Lentisphaeraceae bacterium]